jgi:hypothetical protein
MNRSAYRLGYLQKTAGVLGNAVATFVPSPFSYSTKDIPSNAAKILQTGIKNPRWLGRALGGDVDAMNNLQFNTPDFRYPERPKIGMGKRSVLVGENTVIEHPSVYLHKYLYRKGLGLSVPDNDVFVEGVSPGSIQFNPQNRQLGREYAGLITAPHRGPGDPMPTSWGTAERGHPILGGYSSRITPDGAAIEYKDIWDVALNRGEPIRPKLTDNPAVLSGGEPLKVYSPEMRKMGYEPDRYTNLLRYIASKTFWKTPQVIHGISEVPNQPTLRGPNFSTAKVSPLSGDPHYVWPQPTAGMWQNTVANKVLPFAGTAALANETAGTYLKDAQGRLSPNIAQNAANAGYGVASNVVKPGESTLAGMTRGAASGMIQPFGTINAAAQVGTGAMFDAARALVSQWKGRSFLR